MAILLAGVMVMGLRLTGQENQKETPEGYQFTIDKNIPVTSIKDQHRSRTCWSFASVSFLEAELLRTGQGVFDLSEMYFVRQAYMEKAEKYVRMHGKNNFGSGGLAMDMIHTWKTHGMVPEAAFTCLTIGDSLPVHNEMDAVLKGYINQVIKNPNRTLTPVWKEGFKGIQDAYLGPEPTEFNYQGTSYTPRSFADGLGLDPDDYVVVGSYTHHPFYEEFILEIPDNWNWSSIENVTLNEMMDVLDHALDIGYTVCWDADIGEKGFDWKGGIALIPSMEIEDLSGLERARWDELSEREKVITQEIRQEAFDNYQTTDDHLMHITGTARDQQGNRYYLVKNSWGTGNHIYDGYLYVSEAYMRAKTIFFMVHRDAVPLSIADKLER